MSIPIESITAGVWEAVSPWDTPRIVNVILGDDGVLYAEIAGSGDRNTLSTLLREGWTFTARYARCDGKPEHVRAIYIDKKRVFTQFMKDGPRDGSDLPGFEKTGYRIVPGLFIPAEEPTP